MNRKVLFGILIALAIAAKAGHWVYRWSQQSEAERAGQLRHSYEAYLLHREAEEKWAGR